MTATNDSALANIADAIQEHNWSAERGTTAIVGVTIELVLHLGYDRLESVTPERLAKALLENAASLLELSDVNVIDSLSLIELRDES